MEFEVEIEKGGITFIVSGYYDMEGVVDSIDKVIIYQDNKSFEVSFDSDKFITDFEAELLNAIEDEKRNAAIAHAEMQMDAAREEGWK